MPQNIRDGGGGGNNGGDGAAGAAAYERLRAMLLSPASSRPSDWVNPLEKIEQLLTCSICLDRYKNPKLLPCQHTFCMEPCLDGLIDLVRRMVRCPECRAEHPLPYDGLKGLQTNYTLSGFLEIHVQATEENATELEAYVRRYNLERCKICDEKAEVDYCPHCEKRICLECKTTHADMIKRDLGRLMNQVKRACGRIVDSSDTLARGVESLNVNCENVKEEIRDYVRRYIKELKKREESMIGEVEAFYAGETRMINTVRDNLELEAKNMNEACSRVESCLKGEKELTDEELVRYKQMFTEGLDYLRMANPDADELINKKIRFVITDAHMLSHAILQFGELQICTPQFNHKFVHAEKMYVPRFLQLGLESDNYPGKKRVDQQQQQTAGASADLAAPSSAPSWKAAARAGAGAGAGDEDAYSSRYRRRQYLEDQAWSRVRSGQGQDQDRRSPRTAGGGPDEASASASSAGTSPGTSRGGVVATAQRAVSDLTPEVVVVVAGGRQRQQRAGDAEDRDIDERVASIRREHERRYLDSRATGTGGGQQQKRVRNRTAPINPAGAAAMARAGGGDQQDQAQDQQDENVEDPAEEDAIPVQMFPVRVDTLVVDGAAANNWRRYLIPSPPDQLRHRQRAATIGSDPTPAPAEATTTNGSSTGTSSSSTRDSDPEIVAAAVVVNNNGSSSFTRSRTNPDFNIDSPPTGGGSPVVRRAAADLVVGLVGSDHRGRRRRRTTSAGSSDGDVAGGAHRYHPRQLRDDDDVDFGLDPYVGLDGRIADAAQRFEATIMPPAQRGDRQSSSPQRRYEGRQSSPQRRYYQGGGGGGDQQERQSSPQRRYYQQQQRAGAFGQQPSIDYQSKGQCVTVFGTKGAGDGQFNWPRGLAVLPGAQEIVVCDSSNHRLQIFDRRGRFVRTLGSYGSGRAEFDCLAGVCVTRHGQLIVTDRYNHRVQIFDQDYQFVRQFGSHGQTNGKFNSPWGLAVDQQGFIYICDKDNHRVQIFQSDGNYVGKFGSLGDRDGQFHHPHFVACNRHNQLLVSDSSNHRVQVFDHNGHFLFSFGAEGYQEGQFKYPRGVAVDDQGFVSVADSGNNRVQVFGPDGRYLTSFGTWGSQQGAMKGVEGLALTADGGQQLIVADRENHRVQIF